MTGGGVRPGMPVYSVVVPVRDEEACLGELHRRLAAVRSTLGEPSEVVFVDDGSTDGSPDIIRRICCGDTSCRAVVLARSFGHQAAISAGLRYARGRAVIVMDGDLQDPPELIPEMIARWKAGADVVHGRRVGRRGEPLAKRASASLFYRLLAAVAEVPLDRDTGDFRLLDRGVCDHLDRLGERHRYLRGMVGWLGFRQEAVEYEREPRFAGATKYPLRRMAALAADALTSFSRRPLRIAGWLGMLTSLGGIAWLLVPPATAAARAAASGGLSPFAMLLLVQGLTLLVLGVFGAYLGRMHDELKGRPLFVVSHTIGGGSRHRGLPPACRATSRRGLPAPARRSPRRSPAPRSRS